MSDWDWSWCAPAGILFAYFIVSEIQLRIEGRRWRRELASQMRATRERYGRPPK